MDNMIGVTVDNPEGIFHLDKTAEYMPISVRGKPIGFVTHASDERVTAVIWMENFNIIRDEDENIVRVELDQPPEDILFTPMVDDE